MNQLFVHLPLGTNPDEVRLLLAKSNLVNALDIREFTKDTICYEDDYIEAWIITYADKKKLVAAADVAANQLSLTVHYEGDDGQVIVRYPLPFRPQTLDNTPFFSWEKPKSSFDTTLYAVIAVAVVLFLAACLIWIVSQVTSDTDKDTEATTVAHSTQVPSSGSSHISQPRSTAAPRPTEKPTEVYSQSVQPQANCPAGALFDMGGGVVCHGEMPAVVTGPAIIEWWISSGTTAGIFYIEEGQTYSWSDRGHYYIFSSNSTMLARYPSHKQEFLARDPNHIEGWPPG